MQISQISALNRPQNVSNKRNIASRSITFEGLKTPKTKSMFVFDLDGTLATATTEQLKTIFNKAKSCNSEMVYATGRTFKEFFKLQNKMANKGIELPIPNYLIANNGQFLYENIDGVLIENLAYQEQLIQKTNYNRDIVTQIMRKFAKSDRYKYTQAELNTLKNLNEVKISDPEFFDSKISYYEWNPSKNMAEYFLAHDINIEEFKKEVVDALAQKGCKVKFRENHYSKPVMDACNESILLQANTLRRFEDGSMNALFLCAADKSDGIDFIRKSKGINFSEILMAGNDDNDIPMAKLAQKGAKFICLNDASTRLINYCKNLKENVLVAVKNGADAIIEGLEVFTK